jgi:hypothetical protein
MTTDLARDIINAMLEKKQIVLEPGESPKDVTEAVISFADMVIIAENRDEVEKDVVTILSLFDYLTPEAEKHYGVAMLFPKPKDIRDYIRRRRKRIMQNARKDKLKQADVKARVNKENFAKARNANKGEKVDPLSVFYFFGVG